MRYPELNNTCLKDLPNEVWKDISSHVGIYKISNYGRVKRGTGFNRAGLPFLPLLMKVHPDSKGYPQVCLAMGNRRVARIHRLVAEEFLNPPTEDLVAECVKVGYTKALVNHKNGDKMNPHLDNLEWCTPTYNARHAHFMERDCHATGEEAYNSKLTCKDVDEILKMLTEGEASQEKIALKFGVKQITISNIKCGRSWHKYTKIPKVARTRRRNISKDMVQ